MSINFGNIAIGTAYSRKFLAKLWGYSGFQALARGVVTPKHDHKIILFVTEDKPDFAEPYVDRLVGETLDWEGPTDHYAEDRMIASGNSADEIHLFHRKRHHRDFFYLGRLSVIEVERHGDRPSRFKFRLIDSVPSKA